MKEIKFLIVLVSLMFFILAGCANTKTSSVALSYNGISKCLSLVNNASYTGTYLGEDNNLSPDDFGRDIFCANEFFKSKYPKGFVTIYGSSRIRESNNLSDTIAANENTIIYQEVMDFAESWTKKYGSKYPIMTGAGPGIMEAGSRGAMKAGGPSIGYTTYYDPEPRGDVKDAFWTYSGQQIITDGLIFSSVSMRETFMILHSTVVIIAPGGTGTEWEIFQILESVKSKQLKKVPIYLIGSKQSHWKSFYERLDDMVRRGTIKQDEVTMHFKHVENSKDLVGLIENDLMIN